MIAKPKDCPITVAESSDELFNEWKRQLDAEMERVPKRSRKLGRRTILAVTSLLYGILGVVCGLLALGTWHWGSMFRVFNFWFYTGTIWLSVGYLFIFAAGLTAAFSLTLTQEKPHAETYHPLRTPSGCSKQAGPKGPKEVPEAVPGERQE